MSTKFENFQSKLGLYCTDLEDQFVEMQNFREATALEIEELANDNENLRTELTVLRLAIAALGPMCGEPSKVKIPESKALGGARSAKEDWRIFFLTWGSISQQPELLKMTS